MSDTPLQDEEEEEENRLAEAAERRFEEQQREAGAFHQVATEQPEAGGHSFVNLSFEHEPEAPLSPAGTQKDPSALPPSCATASSENH